MKLNLSEKWRFWQKWPRFSFMKRRQVTGLMAVAIHRESLRIAQVVKDEGKHYLRICGQLPAKTELERLEQLKSFVKEHSLHGAYCVGVLAPSEYKLVQAEAPNVPSEDRKQALRWQLKDIIDYPPEESVIDIFDQPSRGLSGTSNIVNVVVAHRDSIIPYVNMCDAIGLNLIAVDVPELAVRNILSLLPENEGGIAFIYILHNHSSVLVVRDSKLFLIREISIGQHLLKNALQQDGPMVNAQAPTSELRRVLDSLILEIQRSQDYYESYYRQKPVSAIVISPLPFDIPHLLSYLAQGLGVGTVKFLDIDGLLNVEKQFTQNQHFCGLPTIGSALRLMPEIP